MSEAFTHILAFAAGVITLAGALVAFGAWLGREASKALEAEKTRAINAENYERAALLRDVIARQFGATQ